jgi:hypothetical protein
MQYYKGRRDDGAGFFFKNSFAALREIDRGRAQPYGRGSLARACALTRAMAVAEAASLAARHSSVRPSLKRAFSTVDNETITADSKSRAYSYGAQFQNQLRSPAWVSSRLYLHLALPPNLRVAMHPSLLPGVDLQWGKSAKRVMRKDSFPST